LPSLFIKYTVKYHGNEVSDDEVGRICEAYELEEKQLQYFDHLFNAQVSSKKILKHFSRKRM
jgi:hypothetical protein